MSLSLLNDALGARIAPGHIDDEPHNEAMRMQNGYDLRHVITSIGLRTVRTNGKAPMSPAAWPENPIFGRATAIS
jgi:hypothetical protein